jgi:hypothetical protein
MTGILRCGRGLFGLPAVVALVAVAAVAAAPASAATPAPAWRIHSLAVPTNFTPGATSGDNFYEVTIANSGGAPTDGSPIVIVDTLPEGAVVEDVELPLRSGGGMTDFGPTLCVTEKPAATDVVRCTIPGEISGADPEPAVLEASETLRLVIHVSTPGAVEGDPLVNVARVEGGGAPSASVSSENQASSTPAPPGFSEFHSEVTGVDGLPVTAAGSHPYQYTTSFAVNTEPALVGTREAFAPAGGDVKDIRVTLPPGFVGNPTATTRCTGQQFNDVFTVLTPGGGFYTRNSCPDGSAVGFIIVQQVEGAGGIVAVPIYNLVPPVGMPAQLGFKLFKASFLIDTALVRDGEDYRIVAQVRNTTQVKRVTAASVTIWGVPSDPSHDRLRGSCVQELEQERLSRGLCPSGLVEEPFLRLPTSCEDPMTSLMSFDIWPNPGVFVETASAQPALVDCASLDFSPTVAVQPHNTAADSPTGLRFNLHLPQSDDPDRPGEADLRDAVVTLPEGMMLNPSSANGLAGCSPAQIGLTSAPGATPLTFTPEPARCPDASKVGSVKIETPLLDHPLEGSVHVATPDRNPFGSLIALYIVLDDVQSGIVVKLAGRVTADSVTGRLTTRFANNPQLPFEDFTVEFFDGPRGPLRTPVTCGAYTTATSMKPWSAPESGPDAMPSDSFTVSRAPGGGPCASSEGELPHAPAFSAGSTAPVAGAYSPFVTILRREDGSQGLRGLNVALPEGLLGRLAGVPYCPEVAIAASAAQSGNAELAAPSCPAASRVGTVDVSAGAGSQPVHVAGAAYLAGPYRGAPLSLAVVTPAVAGPFDLGTVVVRAALRVDSRTTEVSVDSDPIPTILQGIPLDVRSISVNVDRPSFTLNPTDCRPKTVGAEAISLLGRGVALADRFQVGGCRGLDFSPRLGLRLFGGTKRADNPRLTAVLRPRDGEANIARATVALPHSVFLDQAHIRTICTRVQFAADQCPAGAIYGFATAETPLLDAPLRGPVFLRSSDNPLPDLVVALRGQVDIDLVGRIDSVRGGIRTSFDFVPDAPVSKFVLRMKGGRKSLLVNSTDICRSRQRATVKMDGQNGRAHDFRPVLKNQCGKKVKKRRGP